MKITGKRIKGLFGKGVVFSWANLGDNAGVQQKLSGRLSKNGDKKSDPCKLKSITQDIEVSGCEDEGDDGSVGNAGSSGVVPREETGKERVVVCELLAGCSRCSGCLSRSCKVGEFGLGLCSLVLYALCGGTYCNIVSGVHEGLDKVQKYH